MSSVNTNYLNSLRKDLVAYSYKRRDVIKNADDALHHAKRAIFALHRDNRTEAEAKLKEAEELLLDLHKKYKNDRRISSEGSYRAALEEYVESCLFYQFVTTGKIGKIQALSVEGEAYIAGLCDVPGELCRYAIKAATKRDLAMVQKCADTASEIIGELIEFNLTSYLRTKFDQAKMAVNKLEQVVYEVSIRVEKKNFSDDDEAVLPPLSE